MNPLVWLIFYINIGIKGLNIYLLGIHGEKILLLSKLFSGLVIYVVVALPIYATIA